MGWESRQPITLGHFSRFSKKNTWVQVWANYIFSSRLRSCQHYVFLWFMHGVPLLPQNHGVLVCILSSALTHHRGDCPSGWRCWLPENWKRGEFNALALCEDECCNLLLMGPGSETASYKLVSAWQCRTVTLRVLNRIFQNFSENGLQKNQTRTTDHKQLSTTHSNRAM